MYFGTSARLLPNGSYVGSKIRYFFRKSKQKEVLKETREERERENDEEERKEMSAKKSGASAEPPARVAAFGKYIDDLTSAVDSRARSKEAALGLENLDDGTYDEDEVDEEGEGAMEGDEEDGEEKSTSRFRSCSQFEMRGAKLEPGPFI